MPVKKSIVGVRKVGKTIAKKPVKKTTTKVKAKAIAKSSSNVYIDMRKTTRPSKKPSQPKPQMPTFIHTTSQIPIYQNIPSTATYAPKAESTSPVFVPSIPQRQSFPGIARFIGEDIPIREPRPITISRPEPIIETEQKPIITESEIITNPVIKTGRTIRVPTKIIGQPQEPFVAESVNIMPTESESASIPSRSPLSEHTVQSGSASQFIPAQPSDKYYGLTREEMSMYATYINSPPTVAENLLRRRLADRKGSPLNAPPEIQRRASLEILQRAEKKYIKDTEGSFGRIPGRAMSPRPRSSLGKSVSGVPRKNV